MLYTKVSVENAEVISSGSIISLNLEPINIALLDDNKEIFKIKFRFDGEDSKKQPSISIAVEKNVLTFSLHDFTNPIGSGNTKPIEFGTYKNKTLFLNYRIAALGESDKTLTYTIYATEVKRDGKEEN